MKKTTLHPRQAWLVLIASAIVYGFYYRSNPALPGANPEYPLGWWGWFDQGQYLKSALAFVRGDFSPGNHYYPPLYPAIGALFVGWMPTHPFLLFNGLAFVLFAHGFVAVGKRYIGFPGALLLLVASVYMNGTVMENFAIPWTSACTLVAVAVTLLLLLRLDRAPRPSPARLAAMALALSLTFGLLALARPMDALLAGVFFPALAWMAWRPGPQDAGAAARLRRVAPACALLLVGPAVSAAVFLTFNRQVFGDPFGGYFGATASASGYFPSEFPRKALSLLIDSYSLYLEPGASLLTHYRWFALSVAGMALAFWRGDVLLRVIAAAIVLQFALYLPYGDLLPNGLWRYKNIHYFKWTIPFLALYAWLAVQWTVQAWQASGLRGLARTGGAVLALVLLVCSLSLALHVQPLAGHADPDRTVRLALPAGRTDFVDLPGFQGSFAAVYFGEHRVWLDGRPLQRVRDFRMLPAPDGVRLLFNRPVQGAALALQPDPGVVAGPSAPVAARHGIYRLGLGRPRLRHD